MSGQRSVHAGSRRKRPPAREHPECLKAIWPGKTTRKGSEMSHDKRAKEGPRSKPQESSGELRELPAGGEAAGRNARRETASVFYVERLEAFAFEALFRGVSRFLILKRADLHTVIFVFLGGLHKGSIMFFLQTAGNAQRIVLP